MSFVSPNEAVVVRAAEAEIVGGESTTVRLLADASAIGGAFSSQRVTLATGADGAVPHYHATATELFYVLAGRLQVLAGKDVVTAGEGDLLAVPPNMAHAFGAAPGAPADVLIVITPGVERFDYFRLLARLGAGEATLDELLESQDRFDNHFLDSAEWRQARSG
ncbi:MAG TPA: cupin domain-containing protein [Streptosporangiaceae bacterium]|jgi:quercetin dioxygenase-like cupin family protein